jgi:hypothetical protein
MYADGFKYLPAADSYENLMNAGNFSRGEQQSGFQAICYTMEHIVRNGATLAVHFASGTLYRLDAARCHICVSPFLDARLGSSQA